MHDFIYASLRNMWTENHDDASIHATAKKYSEGKYCAKEIDALIEGYRSEEIAALQKIEVDTGMPLPKALTSFVMRLLYTIEELTDTVEDLNHKVQDLEYRLEMDSFLNNES